MKIRQSNFELLRIVCMFLIVLHHIIVHGNFDYKASGSILSVIMPLLAIGGRVGVNVFILLTGYFSFTRQFDVKKVLQLILQVYSGMIIIFLISLLWKRSFSGEELLLFINPLGNGLWFIREFILLLCLTPLLNKFISVLDKSKTITVLLIGFFSLSLLPSFVELGFFKSNIFWFSYLYILAASYRKYKPHFIAVVPIFIVTIVYYLLAYIFHFSGVGEQYSIFMLGLSLTMFILFEHLPLGGNQFINKLAGLTFGVYIIHDFSIIRNMIVSVVDLKRVANFSIFSAVGYTILCAIIVYILASLLEYIRQVLFNKLNAKVIVMIEDYFKS